MSQQLVGRTGVVTLAIPGGETLGEIELPFGGGTERFLARATEPLDDDTPVLVIAELPGRVVDVERWTTLPGL
ncbi:hypothetical protein [Gordonia amicalis]|uniref:hypothetical protein n=1 Tax=Gordonia amicalis TaxID=89053 RepID=UPI0002A63322|nr:hypothetical protein [Gordonia amicalis]MCZ0911221.1 hypothetical protein [Gordonia amicalis]NKX77104.1 hypothetical protein [Gordonia amicalis]GAC52088.1 hypothetical protein GOAMI_07_00920 [Gordonia amicalis NBRC 100051 = JCM 11271]